MLFILYENIAAVSASLLPQPLISTETRLLKLCYYKSIRFIAKLMGYCYRTHHLALTICTLIFFNQTVEYKFSNQKEHDKYC